MSFAMTTQQVRAMTKDVTRRIGWVDLQPDTLLQPIVKGQGLKKGETVERIGGPIRVVNARVESLALLIASPTYGRREVKREGFHGFTRHQFVDMFAKSHGCDVDAKVTRIEFRYAAYCVDCRAEIAGSPGFRNLCGECACEDDGL